MKRLVTFVLTVLLVLTHFSIPVSAAYSRKNSYIYSYWGEPIPSALGLTHLATYNQQNLGVPLNDPQDLDTHENQIYIIDAANKSLIILDSKFNVLTYRTEFELDESVFNHYNARAIACTVQEQEDEQDNTQKEEAGDPVRYCTTLNGPQGVFATDDYIYIADTANHRILQLTHELKVVYIIGVPNDQLFIQPEDYEDASKNPGKYRDKVYFQPTKVAIDQDGRIYVISQNVYQGIVELNKDGSFNRYFGVNRVTLNVFEAIWRRFASEEQLRQMRLILPTSFKNLEIDHRGFVYATAAAVEGDSNNMIKLINPKGDDVLLRNGYAPPKGDLVYSVVLGYVTAGPSDLVDITVNNYGMYTVVDQRRGRLFTYDHDGRLLYISSDQGRQDGMLQTPVAVAYFGERLLVLDAGTDSIEIFGPTEFGALVNEAVYYHYEGEYERSSELWDEVARLNTNYEIAYIGIGKSLLAQGKYKEAMHYFKLGHERYYYSKAFEGYRNEMISKNFGWVMTVASLIILVAISVPIINFLRGNKEEEYE